MDSACSVIGLSLCMQKSHRLSAFLFSMLIYSARLQTPRNKLMQWNDFAQKNLFSRK